MWNKLRLSGSCLTRQGVIFLYVLSFGLLCLILPFLADFAAPKVMLTSDYVMDFYPAGKLIIEHRAQDIYVSNTKEPLIDSAFNKFVHILLPDLPSNNIALFMYPPLTAIVFAAFAFLSAPISLIAWQLVSIGAFLLSIVFVSAAVNQNFKKYFWYSMLYLPVFYTLLIGQCGLVLGLLPLAIGYLLLTRQYPFLAGLAWSCVLLKPQLLPVVLLFLGVLVLNKKYRCISGFILGVILQLMLTGLVLGSDSIGQWIVSLKTSDNFFCDPRHTYRFQLMTCLPAAIMQLFPIAWREALKVPAYIGALVLGLHALWFSARLLKRSADCEAAALCSIFIIGIGILPLVEPHFFLYDFSVLAFFAVLLNSALWTESQNLRLKTMNVLYLLSMDIYYFLTWTAARNILQPIVLMIIVAFLYYRLIIIMQNKGMTKNENSEKLNHA